MPEAPIILTMSRPPSLNKLWITVSGKKTRVRSQSYSEWLRVAGWDVRRQMVGMPTIACRYNMLIEVPISRRDSGNWEKAIGDLLEKCGVVSNDGNVHNLTVTPMERDDCAIFLTPLPEMGGIRKAAPLKYKSYEPKVKKKPTAKAIAAFERIRSGLLAKKA